MPLGILRKILHCLRKLLEKCKRCVCKCHRFKCSLTCEDVESDCCRDPPAAPRVVVEEEKGEKDVKEMSTETSRTDKYVYPEVGEGGPMIVGEAVEAATPSPGAPEAISIDPPLVEAPLDGSWCLLT